MRVATIPPYVITGARLVAMVGHRRSSAAQWERFGQIDPYFGVLSDEMYRREHLTADTVSRFFEHGRGHVHDVMEMMRAHTGEVRRPASVMDFGCGVGRLLPAFAQRAERVVGVDVARSMLAEAQIICAEQGIENVQLVETAQLSALRPEFDLIHSHIVFQHIPVAEGYQLFEQLARMLAPGGVGVMHVTLTPVGSATFSGWILKHVPLSHKLANLRRGRGWSYPTMEMNSYSIERLAAALARLQIRRISIFYQPAGGPGLFNSAVLVFERPNE